MLDLQGPWESLLFVLPTQNSEENMGIQHPDHISHHEAVVFNFA